LFAALGFAIAASAAELEIVGAGASFPAPVIAAWADQYGKEASISLHYRSVGSGEGIRRVMARTTDFAMTDVPLTSEELAKDDLMQFPVVVGAVVPAVNLPGVADAGLILTGSLLADIYLGRITRWDDPAILLANPDLSLPALPITLLHRSDGSGTSFLFTYYLSKVSPEWQDRLGIGSRLVWPAGSGVKGNDGMAEAIEQRPGALGYTEIAFAEAHHLATVRLVNKAGARVRPSERAVRAALATARWSRTGYYEVLADRDGAESWPIVGISFALIHKRPEQLSDAAGTLSFLHWVYAHGAAQAQSLHYVALTDPALIGRIEASWAEIHDDRGQGVWKGR
jgi:phosphate transport system substrate-binding protein